METQDEFFGDFSQSDRDEQARLRRIRERRRARARSASIRRLFLLALVLAAAVWAAVAWPRVAKELTVEAGDPLPEAGDFIRGGFFQAEIVSGLYEPGDSTVLGARQVRLKVMGITRSATVYVVDTVPPVVETRDLRLVNQETVTPEDFLASVEDKTDTTASFAKAPDMTLHGEQEVAVAVTDAGGNRTVAAAALDLVLDTTPPVIEGVKTLTVTMGGTVSYKKDVTVTDDCDENPTLEIDNSQVNLKELGKYTVTYTAEDFAGNRTVVETTLKVVLPADSEVTQEALDVAADQLLAQITTPEMSQYEVAKAIYNWCHGRISYVDTSVKDDWVLAAWQGIMKRQGDCYVYCMSAKELLTRAGIENRVIERIRKGNSMHFWNLIDIGEGWHHFDTTPRAGKTPSFFYLTDSQLMAYSDTHRGTHNYDRTIYTDIVP